MAKVIIKLDREEIQTKIPYALICETMGSSTWDTGKRRRAYDEAFTKAEQEECENLGKLAHKWHLVKGAPDSYSTDAHTIEMWTRLATFCSSL